jgi:two-component SAPR family response regulator
LEIEYGMEAFEKHAVDYVLKPFSRERLDEALERGLLPNGGGALGEVHRALGS